MRTVFLVVSSMTFMTSILGQHIGYFPGNNAEKTFTEVTVPGHWFSGKHSFRRRHEFFVSISLPERFAIAVTHSRFSGWTSFSLEDEFVEKGFAGFGASRLKVLRTGVAVSRELLNFRNIIRFSPFIDLKFERCEYNGLSSGPEFEYVKFYSPVNDISDFKDWKVAVEPFPGSQVVPGFGFRADIRLFWRIYGHLQYGWTFGRRTYQKLYFEHKYLGELRPAGVWYSNGTIRYKGWGLSLKFAGKKDKYDKDKMEWF